MLKEWHGSPVPPRIKTPLPSAAQLVTICPPVLNRLGYAEGIAYPKEAPVYWIKYALNIVWNEMAAQKMAYDGLRALKSSVRAPAAYYGCELTLPLADMPEERIGWRTYIVSEYIPGQTTAERLENVATTEEQKDAIYTSIAFALSELCRIPITGKHFPAAANGAGIRHPFFVDNQSTFHYRNVGELEQHLNEVSSVFFPQITDLLIY